MGEIIGYIIAAIILVGGSIVVSVLWANGVDEMKDEAKRGSNEPGHYWDHLDGDDDE